MKTQSPQATVQAFRQKVFRFAALSRVQAKLNGIRSRAKAERARATYRALKARLDFDT